MWFNLVICKVYVNKLGAVNYCSNLNNLAIICLYYDDLLWMKKS